MPTTIGFEFGDVVLVPFPFTDQTVTKKRPAIVVSSDAYHRRRPDVIVMAVTSQVRPPSDDAEVVVRRWKEAGLLKPSVAKPVLATVERRLVLRKLGALQEKDQNAVREALRVVLG